MVLAFAISDADHHETVGINLLLTTDLSLSLFADQQSIIALSRIQLCLMITKEGDPQTTT